MKLFIVESPKKCKTLKKYLGADYKLASSMGHIRQIPPKGINIDIKNDFTPTFEVPDRQKKNVKELKELATQADEIFLATDPDREGEAISWHLYDILPKKDQAKCTRVAFDEITKKAVLEAVKNKRDIDMNLVNAQKARQILDRLIGYKVSPVLWYTAKISGSSAGRVQSIALRLVCDRQKEIDAFIPEDYWFVEADLKAAKGKFWARVVTKHTDNRYKDEKLADKDLIALKEASYKITDIERKEKSNSPYPPFDTPTLQSASANAFGWSLKKSKTIAQKLYEQGLVTYIRTDSFNISDEAIEQVRGMIKSGCPAEYLPKKANVYKKKSKAAAQEAHECIRPTDVNNKGDDIDDNDEKKMYDLIRRRFVACQMTPQIVDQLIYNIEANSGHKLIARGQTIKFDGWSKVYTFSKTKEEILPEACKGDSLELKDLKKSKHSTKPPSRFNESSLTKKLDEEGVGRPSTRDTIITAIQDKGYVEKEQGKGKGRGLVATILGMKIIDYLTPSFKDFFMDIGYTVQIEDELFDVAEGKKQYLDVINGFYAILMDHIGNAQKDAPQIEKKSMGVKCPVCKENEISERDGRFGKFFSCDGYPKCKTIFVQNEDGKFSIKQKATVKKLGRPCPECEKKGRKGELVERKNKSDGNVFIGCNQYPKCRYSESVEKQVAKD